MNIKGGLSGTRVAETNDAGLSSPALKIFLRNPLCRASDRNFAWGYRKSPGGLC